jgi:hypothetical protein
MTNYVGLGLLAVALAPGCDIGPQYCEGDALPEETVSSVQSRVVAQVNAAESRAVDILFVIDDSRSMMDEQRQLGIWSSELFDVLGSSGELPDLHIGVVSSSIAIAGLAGCHSGGGTFHVGAAKLDDKPFIVDVAGQNGRERNYTGTLTDTFAKMALVGDQGCGFEQPFKAARTLLTSNTGFLREDALLLVVFVTDEDDCSAIDSGLYLDPYGDACSEMGPITSYRCFEKGVQCYDGKGRRAFGDRKNCRPDESSPYIESVSQFADGLKALKKEPGQVVVAGIYGKPNHIAAVPDEQLALYYPAPRLANVCGAVGKEGTGATPAVRMNALMAEFGGRASQSSICDAQLSWAMRDVGLVTRGVAMRSTCLRGSLLDRDVATAGIQPACHVDVIGPGDRAQQKRIAVPPCTASETTRCFTIDADAAQCAETETQLAFHIHNGGENEALTVSCDVDDDATLAPATGVAARSTVQTSSVESLPLD